MIPKQFLVDDMGRELGLVHASLGDIRRRLALTQRQIESQRRMIDALRKRVDRQGVKLKGTIKSLRSPSGSRADAPQWHACSPMRTP